MARRDQVLFLYRKKKHKTLSISQLFCTKQDPILLFSGCLRTSSSSCTRKTNFLTRKERKRQAHLWNNVHVACNVFNLNVYFPRAFDILEINYGWMFIVSYPRGIKQLHPDTMLLANLNLLHHIQSTSIGFFSLCVVSRGKVAAVSLGVRTGNWTLRGGFVEAD